MATTAAAGNGSPACQQSDTAAAAAADSDALVAQLKQKLADKEQEFEAHKKKVDDWKDKVKVMTQKDAQRLEALKKKLQEKDEQVSSLLSQH